MSVSTSHEQLLHYASPVEDRPKTGFAGGGALHLIAVLTACATFPLIFMGGLVTSHQAGMSVPDWPNSYGYNMFLFPPRFWIGGIFYEHTHRLMGTVVGFLSLALVAASFLQPRTGWRQRGLALAVFGAVLFQGILGGLRVVLVKLDLAIVHACFAQAFFCLAAFAALATSRWWNQPQTHAESRGLAARRIRLAATRSGARPGAVRFASRLTESLTMHPAGNRSERALDHGRGLVLLGIATVTVIYLQLIVGATMRHFQAGLAIPDLPLAYGNLIPPTSVDQLESINGLRAQHWNLDPVTLGQIWLHFGHRIGAVLVTCLVLALAAVVFRRYRTQPKLFVPAVLLVGLLLAQLTLGVLTVLLRKPADVASTHVAVGALVLVTSFVLTARAVRLFGFRGTAACGFANDRVS